MIDTESHMTRLHELLADRATQRLSDDEKQELTTLLGPEARGDYSFDRAAATLDLPFILEDAKPIPARLRARVEADAVEWLAFSREASPIGSATSVPRDEPLPSSPAPRITAYTRLPWFAAAAFLLLALVAWWPSRTTSLTAQRSALADVPDTRVFAWTDVGGTGVTGDVMWNNRTQQGFLRLRGLADNDPAAIQYQLWIFDEAREAKSASPAVDGGVFNVASMTTEVIVPIDAKLDVFQPTMFAVTTEPPGGVVVHEDDETRGYAIVLTASPAS